MNISVGMKNKTTDELVFQQRQVQGHFENKSSCAHVPHEYFFLLTLLLFVVLALFFFSVY